MNISTITIDGLDVDFTYTNGFLAYSFEKDGKNYGQKAEVKKSAGVLAIASTVAVLLENIIETNHELHAHD